LQNPIQFFYTTFGSGEELDEAVLHKICRHYPKLHVSKKIKFVGVVVFEKKRFKEKVDTNVYTYAYKRP
jgi:hypothetical protein